MWTFKLLSYLEFWSYFGPWGSSKDIFRASMWIGSDVFDCERNKKFNFGYNCYDRLKMCNYSRNTSIDDGDDDIEILSYLILVRANDKVFSLTSLVEPEYKILQIPCGFLAVPRNSLHTFARNCKILYSINWIAEFLKELQDIPLQRCVRNCAELQGIHTESARFCIPAQLGR